MIIKKRSNSMILTEAVENAYESEASFDNVVRKHISETKPNRTAFKDRPEVCFMVLAMLLQDRRKVPDSDAALWRCQPKRKFPAFSAFVKFAMVVKGTDFSRFICVGKKTNWRLGRRKKLFFHQPDQIQE